jgi:hypothetical protein
MINDGGWGGGTSVYRMYSLVLLFFKDPEDFVPKTFETMGNTMKVRTIDIFANVSYIGKPNRFRMFLLLFQMLHLMMILEILNPLFGYTKES